MPRFITRMRDFKDEVFTDAYAPIVHHAYA